MKNMHRGRYPGSAIPLAVAMLTFALLIAGGPAATFAGDHLAAASPGCTECHGTNIRMVHDYENTIPLDCNICHSTGGKSWYLNDTCADYLEEGGVEVVPVYEDSDDWWQLDPVYEYDFNFECKTCHVGSNPGHQSVNY